MINFFFAHPLFCLLCFLILLWLIGAALATVLATRDCREEIRIVRESREKWLAEMERNRPIV